MTTKSAQPMVVPFRNRTRKRVHPVQNALAWAANKTINVELPKNGLLSAIYIILTGTIANPDNQALIQGWQYPFNLIRRVKFDANIGNAELVNLSGYGLHLVSSNMEEGFRTDKGGAGAAAANSALYAAGSGNGNNAVKFVFKLPIAMNSKENFQAGLINLQDTGLTAKLVLECGQISDILSKAGGGMTATFAGNFEILYEYFEIPIPRPNEVVARPMRAVIRTIETQYPIVATGDINYPVERQGFLLQAIQRFILNDAVAPETALTSFSLRGNLTEYLDRYTPDVLRLEQRMRSAMDYPNEIFHFDFWNSMGDLSSGDTRDLVNTEAYTQLELISTLAAGAVLGVGTNFIHTIQRNYVELEKRG